MTASDAREFHASRRITGPPLVAIIILNWKDCDVTLACLDSLADIGYPRYRIIVVDNESTDESANRLAAAANIELIRQRDNLGFTGGVNVGIRYAVEQGAEYVWLLNSDAVSRPDTLTRLIAVAEADPRIGLVSPVIYDPDARDQPLFCLAVFDPRARGVTQTENPVQARDWQEKCPDQVVLFGTALLIRRTLIETIGLFDERFFAYCEDVDYSLRSLRAGFINVGVAEAIVYHRYKQTTTNPDASPLYLHYYMTRNYFLLSRKIGGMFQRGTIWVLRERLVQIARMGTNRPAVDALLAGLWDGIRDIGGPYDPRRRMPFPLRTVFGRFPRFWIALLDRRLPWRVPVE
jgi:GT2 family glycosyltransferase